MMNRIFKNRLLLLLLIGLGACDGFLDEKPNVSLVVPTSLDDLQALLDNTDQAMNEHGQFPLLRSDEFVADESLVDAELEMLRNVYLWEPNPYSQDDLVMDWTRPFNQILITNIVLEKAGRIQPSTSRETERKAQLMGSAYFFRALANFTLAQVFAPAFRPNGNNNSLCFPLRDTADPNTSFGLSTTAEAYDFIITDLEKALELLPQSSELPTRPNLISAKALLARIYLSMGIYDKAGEYAELVLAEKSDLKDFNEITVSGINPFARFNKETIFYSQFAFSGFTFSQLFKVSDEFLSLYNEDDLRLPLYFIRRPGGWKNFIGHYSGSIEYFSGITTAEMYLIAAESAVRNGNLAKARNLFALLAGKRMRNGLVPDLSSLSDEGLLSEILDERKRELFGRGLRWSDLKRLNLEERFEVTFVRKYRETTISIPPNDSRYVSVIPPREIELESF